MRNSFAKGLMTLVAVLATVALFACDFSLPAMPSPSPSPTQSASPSPSSPRPTPPPSPTPPPPPPPEPPPDLLEYGEVYYMNGDMRQMGIIFAEEGQILNSAGDEGSYEREGDTIHVHFVEGWVAEEDWNEDEGWTATLRIVNTHVLEDVNTGIRFVREFGAGFGGVVGIPSGPSVLFFNVYYHLYIEVEDEEDEDRAADIDVQRLYFYEDGEVLVLGHEDMEHGRYTIAGNTITITIDGEEVMVLGIQNPVHFIDSRTSEHYALEGAMDAQLILNSHYYQFGDVEELSFIFLSDEEVDFMYMGEVLMHCIYESDEDRTTFSIDLDGEEMVLVVVNNYVLQVVDQDVLFIRLPGDS